MLQREASRQCGSSPGDIEGMQVQHMRRLEKLQL